MDVAEHQLTVVPTHHDMAITHKRMSRVAEQMENMSGQMVAMNRQLAMINEYLLNEKRVTHELPPVHSGRPTPGNPAGAGGRPGYSHNEAVLRGVLAVWGMSCPGMRCARSWPGFRNRDW
ncbi:hypothetical protein [Marinobacter subterrani]|uniref:Uncharacterized protein n=1 Tax=Marinobacter subterrani TaxID=1658765 RepID=A0A0J7J5C1_9GAMM|nr:hypothetical protein [Marinobacter subterrani]KMQ73778.1 hypothetical protein Msub_20999 [Marinobacter subterrani]